MGQHQPPYLLGIDCGTQGVRAGLFDLEGRPLVYAAREYPVRFPKPGWAEQDPEDWWVALVAVVRDCLARSGVAPAEIAGLGLDHTSCTVLATDEDGTPLRPALLWMDVRAHEQAARVTESNDPVLRYAGGVESPEWMLPKALWIKENEPQAYQRAARIVESLDWLVHRLTGRWVASVNNATCRWNYARPEGGWPSTLLERLGAGELLDKWPREVLPVGSVVGPLLPRVATELGLDPATPVIEGCIDAYAGMIGLDVLQPGRLALITGSSTCHLAVSRREAFGSRLWGPYQDAVAPGQWILEGGQASTGSIVRWFIDRFANREQCEAEAAGANVYELLDARAAEVRAGAEGLVLLDYWQGNRLPVRDPLARGAIWGLSLNHGVAHILRAIYEGTACGTRHILEEMARVGLHVSEMVACGGGTKSALWMQIYADVCQVPIALTEVQEATVLGSAIAVAAGVGEYASLREAADRMVRIARWVEPNPGLKADYDLLFEQYLATYAQLREPMHTVARWVEKT